MNDRAGSAEAVKALERAGWDEKAESYGLLTGQITARVVEPLLDAAGVVTGMRVLDVATGPGYAARRASERGAVATGVDIADEVLALARRQGGIRFLRGDAEDLPFAGRSFNALVCNFGINHFPRPERAIREFARVVTPGGGIALSTWDLTERNRFLGILVDALHACGVSRPREALAGPDPYRFADEDELRALLRGAGLEDVEVRSVSLIQDASIPVAEEPYPNHKPLRGNYPASYSNSATAPSVRPSGTFDWVAAGVGAAGMLGLVLLLAALNAGPGTARRNRTYDVPLVLQVRDDRPA